MITQTSDLQGDDSMGRFIEQKCVVIIAGEASGDLHGSKLVMAMRRKNKDLFFCGIGGQALKDAGVRILVDASQLAVVGITEVFSRLPNLFKGMTLAKKLLKSLHPDLLILIDFPDFNLHIAATAKKLGIPVLYYISPQIWAWRPGRVKKISRLVNHMAVILPFEENFYKKHKVPVTFVGHPLLDINFKTHNCDQIRSSCLSKSTKGIETLNTARAGEQAEFKKENKDFHIIGLLPGSREGEIKRHLPIMLDAARNLAERIRKIKFIISIAPAVERKYVEELIGQRESSAVFELACNGVKKVFKRCELVVAASGTVTLEAAISGTPMIIIYKVSPVSYWLGRALIRVKNIGLVNLIADKNIVPELLQDKASPENIADTAFNMLSNAQHLEKLKNDLLDIRDTLGGPGASERVADIALNML